MQVLSTQLTLGINLQDEATFDNFHAGKNAQVVTQLKKTVLGQGEKVIYLSGHLGQGRSHLLQACCHYAHQHGVSSVYLPMHTLLNFSPEILNGLESLELICIDDLDLMSPSAEWQEALFHFYNRLHDTGRRLILAAQEIPKAIAFTLPDLISRLSWGIVYQLQALDDREKLSVLLSRASRRGIYLSKEVAKYILTHYPRDMGALFAMLDKLDRASLAAHRRLTIPFVKEVLKQ